MKMMKAAKVYGKNKLRVEEVPVPELPTESVLLKVESCAICGTDLRIYRKGDHRAEYPVITGHEIAGQIVKVAPGVEGYEVGDRVCVAPGHGCGHCKMCLQGQPNVCEHPHPSMGYKINGGFAQYMAVPTHILKLGFVNHIPENLTYDEASLAEIIACCLNAQLNAPVKQGDTVMIMGAGPAGVIHAHLARLKGAKKVIVTQRSPGRLVNLMEKFPGLADATIASQDEDLEKRVMELTDGFGPDVIYVCAPSREAQEQAFRLIRSRGRLNLFGGLPADDSVISINANTLHYKEIFLSGASSSLPSTNRTALQLLSERKIDPQKLITHILPLDRIEEGYQLMEQKKAIKVVIKPWLEG